MVSKIVKFDTDWLLEIRDLTVKDAISYLNTLEQSCILECHVDGEYTSSLFVPLALSEHEILDDEIEKLQNLIMLHKIRIRDNIGLCKVYETDNNYVGNKTREIVYLESVLKIIEGKLSELTKGN